MPATLSSNEPFTPARPQYRFHFVQAIDSGAHLRCISVGDSLSIRDRTPEIHRHLALFVYDDGLNDGRGLLSFDVDQP